MKYKICQVLECVHQSASSVHVRCMTNAWISTHGEKCIKYTTNDQNMININNYGDPHNLVLIRVQNKQQNTIWTFYQTHRVHTLYRYVKQCMNIWKSCLNTCYLCHKGPTSKANYHLKQSPIKKIDKIKISSSHLIKSQLWT